MTSVVRSRLLTFVAGLIIVPVGTILAIMFAKGYRPDLQKGQITATGILSAHSYPENAQIFIDGQLTPSVTNTSLNLMPGRYAVEIKKEGYFSWKKDLEIVREIVTQGTAVLFPTVATLKPINYQPASKVSPSPDGSKVLYLSKNNQVHLLELSESALGTLNRDSKLMGSLPANINRANLEFFWSPDSRTSLIIDQTVIKNSTPSAFLVDTGTQRTGPAESPAYLIQSWKDRRQIQQTQMLSTLPPALKLILATASADLAWSPRENKLLYTATASATLPDQIKKPLPGSSTQPQNRQLEPNQIYVYDIEEDRNFQIDTIQVTTPTPKKSKTVTPVKTPVILPNNSWNWFPTSSHLYKVSGDQVIVVEYDGQNSTIIYTGPLFENTAIPYPSGKLMLLLTKFETTPPASTSAEPSLYALTLR